ncbi:MAG: clostripain-related cysteine peptidase [Candidatus Sericytochromatia bacterium]
MKLSRLTQSLLAVTLLASCAPHAPGPLAGFPRPGLNALSARPTEGVQSQMLLSDNFTQWMNLQQTPKQISRSRAGSSFANETPEGAEVQPGVPVEGEMVAQLPAGGAAKALTYLTYEALDNNLYEDLNRVVDTLELVGSNPQMNLVAQTDNFGPGNAARYYLKQGQFGKITSPHVKIGDQGENSGDPRTMADAVRWGFSSYPARVNWLNISSHGMGFAGIGYDDNPEASMNILSFHQALQAGLGGKKLDIISFDACLMSTVEVGAELQDTANIIVGSEDSTYYWGFGYFTTMSKIAQNPAALNPDQVARGMVVDVNNKGASNQTLTIAATDLRKIGLLEAELDNLAKALRRAMPQHKTDIIRSMQATREFHLAEGIPFRDINRMASLLKQNVKDAEVARICDQINHVMFRRGVIMFSRQSKLEQGQGRGLSIYLPTDGKVSQMYRQTRFAKETQWDEFLVDMNQAINVAAGLPPTGR